MKAITISYLARPQGNEIEIGATTPSKSVVYQLLGEICVFRTFTSIVRVNQTQGYDAKTKKIDEHYRNRSIENSTKPINTRVKGALIFSFQRVKTELFSIRGSRAVKKSRSNYLHFFVIFLL